MFNTVINVIKRRPSILLYIIAIASLIIIFEYNNPLIPILTGLRTSNEGYFLDVLISFLKLVFNPIILLQTVVFVVVVLMILAIFVGLFFSGHFFILMNALQNKAKTKGEFVYGFKKLSVKTTITFFLFLLVNVFFIIYISVCAVPAIVITRAWLAGGVSYSMLAIIIDLITLLIIFFSLMFFRSYTIFWIPAIIAGENKFIYITKEISKSNFWGVTKTLLLFDIIFCTFNILFIYARIKNPDAFYFYGISWVFYIIFSIFLITYIFKTYLSFNRTIE